jgi:phosphohistidine phosphatase
LKRLYILRHAKSSWSDASLSDFDRPLNDRGLAAAPFMGELMAKRGWVPDIFLSSPAERAVQTARLVLDSSGFGSSLILDDRIYEASPQALKQIVSGLSDDIGSAILVGHNPGIEGLVGLMTGENRPMPTAALAIIDIDKESWATTFDAQAVLVEIIKPKELMKGARA